ncbi:hypothetical protein [Crenobacter oryzisoli]|nr:hypothetical protein [Crenobacter sp. SG2303]
MMTVIPLAAYDSCKAVDLGMESGGARLLTKEGGKSGHGKGDE